MLLLASSADLGQHGTSLSIKLRVAPGSNGVQE
jgi:hypothetical protein